MRDPEPKEIFAPYQAFYIQSMLYNAQLVVQALTHVDAIVKVAFKNSPEDPVSAIPVPRMLDALQSAIIHSASLSRYFWPSRKAHNWRGKILREAFDVTEASSLFNRDLRNAIEHFDERLDTYLENGITGRILPTYLGYSGNPEVPTHLFRAYYLDTGEFELLGERHPIPPIATEVSRIYARLLEMDAYGGTFSSGR